jgi:hypothetical protein
MSIDLTKLQKKVGSLQDLWNRNKKSLESAYADAKNTILKFRASAKKSRSKKSSKKSRSKKSVKKSRTKKPRSKKSSKKSRSKKSRTKKPRSKKSYKKH